MFQAETNFQVTQIVRFLLERGLRFRNLGFCGHDLMQTATFNAPVPIYPEGLAFKFFAPFLEAVQLKRMTRQICCKDRTTPKRVR